MSTRDPWPWQRASYQYSHREGGQTRTFRQRSNGIAGSDRGTRVKGNRLVNDFNVARKGLVGFLRKLTK